MGGFGRVDGSWHHLSRQYLARMLRNCYHDYDGDLARRHRRPSVCSRGRWQLGQNSGNTALGGFRCGGVDAVVAVGAAEGIAAPCFPGCRLGTIRSVGLAVAAGHWQSSEYLGVVETVLAESIEMDTTGTTASRYAPSCRFGYVATVNGHHVKTYLRTSAVVLGWPGCGLPRHRCPLLRRRCRYSERRCCCRQQKRCELRQSGCCSARPSRRHRRHRRRRRTRSWCPPPNLAPGFLCRRSPSGRRQSALFSSRPGLCNQDNHARCSHMSSRSGALRRIASFAYGMSGICIGW